MEIRTNNKPRPIIYGFELSDKEKQDFDYLGDELDDSEFFRYKGHVYDLGEFIRFEDSHALPGWQGYSAHSYFSGMVVRYTPDYDSVIVGQYFY